MELLQPRPPSDEATRSIYVDIYLGTKDKWPTGLHFSSICNKTALLFHENNKFNIVKEKIKQDSTGKTTFRRAVNCVISNF